MSVRAASGELVWEFSSPTHLSSSVSYPLDQSGLENPTVRHDTAGLALRVTGSDKSLHCVKVEIPVEGWCLIWV
jgi:hypothetical protein